jgi:hypothetical protein
MFPELDFYPEEAKGPVTKINQGSKWLHEVDHSLLTPMIRIPGLGDFYVDEAALLNDDLLFCPRRWFKRDGNLWAKGFYLLVNQERNMFYIEEGRIQERQASDFKMPWPKLSEQLGLGSEVTICMSLCLLYSSRKSFTLTCCIISIGPTRRDWGRNHDKNAQSKAQRCQRATGSQYTVDAVLR